MDEGTTPVPWHSKTTNEVMQLLHTSADGLSDAEASKRLTALGKNVLHERKKKSIAKMLVEQISDIMVLILLGAALLSMVLGEWTEAIVILTIIVIDAVIGVVQEIKAANALEALKGMSAPTACVLRNGEDSIVPVSELVPGDIVRLEDGAIVPADIRILEENRDRKSVV